MLRLAWPYGQVMAREPEQLIYRCLDMASADAERLYARQGWQLCEQIPDYALLTDGVPPSRCGC